MPSTAELVAAIALSFQGASRNGNKTERALHQKIINTFNKVKPHGYTAQMSDPWCAETWTAVQILAGNKQSEVPMSASCTQLIADSKKLGIWIENENCKPKVGWGIIYDWQDGSNYASTDNKGAPDHVGTIYSVDAKNIYVIEGNKGNPSVCGKRAVAINGRYIRGFIAPKYSALNKTSYKPIIPYVGKLPSTVVHYGSSGNDAKYLQDFLNWAINAKLSVDGDFGRLSTEALLVYQKTYNLSTDGFFGPASLKQAQKIIASYKETEIPKPYEGTMPTLTRIVNNRQKKLADKANQLAYTTNTKEASYPSGKPTTAYKNALAKLPASGHSWSKAAKAGASCDVFVWTCIRDAGIAAPKRAGLWYLTDWLKDSSIFTMVKASEAQPGDIGMYRKDKSGKHGHIFICYGTYKNLKADEKGKVKEASAGSYYGKTTNSLRDRLNIKGKKYVYVFRAKTVVTERPVAVGDTGDNVKNLQKYLNWYFDKKVLEVDGQFGPKTEQAVKDFQKDFAMIQSGKVDTDTLLKMKTAVKKKNTEVTPKPTTPTTPTTPTKTTAQKIADEAVKLAWPKGTAASKYAKDGGSATAIYKETEKKFYTVKNLTECHVFVATTLAAIGIKGMPVDKWTNIFAWLRKNFKEIKVNYTQEQLKAGDIRVHKNSEGGYHIWIIADNSGTRAEAAHNKTYPHINPSKKGNVTKHKGDWLFRAK